MHSVSLSSSSLMSVSSSVMDDVSLLRASLFPRAAPGTGGGSSSPRATRGIVLWQDIRTSLPLALMFAHRLFPPSLKIQAVVLLTVWHEKPHGGGGVYGATYANTYMHTKMLFCWLPRALDADIRPSLVSHLLVFLSVSQNRQQIPEKSQKKKKKTKWRGDRATGSHKLQCVIL